MKGILIKDGIVLKSQAKSFIFVYAVWGVMAVMYKNFYFLSGFICILSLMVPLNTIAYDEKAGWDKYALTMPVSRKNMVIGKYAVGIISGAMAMLLSIAAALFVGEKILEVLISCAAVFAVSVMMISVVLPIIFKFGVEKGRLVFMGVSVLFALIVVLISMGNVPALSQGFLKAAAYSMPFVAIAMLAASVALSVYIYKAKEL